MQEKAKEIVLEYVNSKLDKTDNILLRLDQIYVVWFCKTLKNWKCLISTELPDCMYYEITYNGDKEETYLDAYKKFENKIYKG